MTETRKTYGTGAERSVLDTERFDLVSPIALRRLAATYAEGAAKYSDHNWRKGFPVSSLLNHVLAHLANYQQGVSPDNEDELAHAAWGLFALMEQEVTHPELDDRWQFVAVASPHAVLMAEAGTWSPAGAEAFDGAAARCSVIHVTHTDWKKPARCIHSEGHSGRHQCEAGGIGEIGPYFKRGGQRT